MRTTQIQLKEQLSLGGVTHVEKALRAIPGVKETKVQIEAKRVTIEHEVVEETKLLGALRATGVSAELIPSQAEVLALSVPRMGGETDP